MRRRDDASASPRSGRGALSSRLAAPLVALGAGVAVLTLPAAPAFGDEFPRRRAGLWEMKTSGGPVGAQTLQQCIDAGTDDLLRMQSNEGRNCSKPVVERNGNRYRVTSLCDQAGTKSSLDGVYTMTKDTEYTGDMKMTFDPPLSGASEMNMKMDGKWVGACKPGMKPGDVVMQGMPRLNVLEMGRGGGGVSAEQARRMAEEMQKNMEKPRTGAQPR